MTMRMKNHIFLVGIFTVVLFNCFLIARGTEIKTPSYLTIGGDIKGNYYQADFQQFEGVNNCCTKFGNTLGLGYNIHAGYEHLFSSGLFGFPWRLDLSFSYVDYSADFRERYEFANIIYEDRFVKGIAEYVLEPNIQAISIDPGIIIEPFANMPLSFRLGLNYGILFNKSFLQQENLIEPQDVYYENGSRTRGQASGDIPNAGFGMLSTSIAIRYKLAETGNFEIYPQIRFDYALNNIVDNLSWKTHSIMAGVTLAYNLSKTVAKPIIPEPPMLEPPAQEIKPFIEADVLVKANGKELKNDETINYSYDLLVSNREYKLLPYVFYVPNTVNRISIPADNRGVYDEQGMQDRLITAAADRLKSNPQSKLELISSSLLSENTDIVDARINDVIDELIYNSIEIHRINVLKNEVDQTLLKRPELAEEQSYIELRIDGEKIPINYSRIIAAETVVKSEIPIDVLPSIHSNVDVKDLSGSVKLNDKHIFKFGTAGLNDKITKDILSQAGDVLSEQLLTVSFEAQGPDGLSKKVQRIYKLSPQLEREVKVTNQFQDGEKKFRKYIASYYDFDSSIPKYINNDVIQQLKEEITKGKKITLMPLTDNIGTELYNTRLAEQRAKSVIELSGIEFTNYDIVYPKEYFYDNTTPLGRMLNRTVIVIVSDN